MVAGHRVLLLVAVAAAVVAVAVAAEEVKPTIEAQAPAGSDDATDDDDGATPAGAPSGTTMTDSEPEATKDDGAGGVEAPAASGAAPIAVAARLGAVAALAAGAFAF